MLPLQLFAQEYTYSDDSDTYISSSGIELTRNNKGISIILLQQNLKSDPITIDTIKQNIIEIPNQNCDLCYMETRHGCIVGTYCFHAKCIEICINIFSEINKIDANTKINNNSNIIIDTNFAYKYKLTLNDTLGKSQHILHGNYYFTHKEDNYITRQHFIVIYDRYIELYDISLSTLGGSSIVYDFCNIRDAIINKNKILQYHAYQYILDNADGFINYLRNKYLLVTHAYNILYIPADVITMIFNIILDLYDTIFTMHTYNGIDPKEY